MCAYWGMCANWNEYCILVFMTSLNFMLSLDEHENIFITSGLGATVIE